MIKRKYMRTRQLKPGMVIDQVIKDSTGRNLVVQGSAIDDYIIASLLKLGIMSVYIREGSADPDDPDAILSPKAAAMVKQLRTDDRSKVTLSDSVRQRVSTGVQYIFNNTSSEELTQATNQIADSLMEAINENDAIAVDISSLKTSDEYTFKHSVGAIFSTFRSSACCAPLRTRPFKFSPAAVRLFPMCGSTPPAFRPDSF